MLDQNNLKIEYKVPHKLMLIEMKTKLEIKFTIIFYSS